MQTLEIMRNMRNNRGASKCLCLAIWKFPSRRPRYFTTDKSFVINQDSCIIKVKYKVICVVLFKQT